MHNRSWILLSLAVGAIAAGPASTLPVQTPPLQAPAAGTVTTSQPTISPPTVERRMEYLRPAEFRQLRDQAPIAYLAWGSHEWHGPHLPLGTDTVKAHWLCRELADRTGGVVYPAVYFGFGVMANPGKDTSLGFPKEIVQQLARHYFLKLYEKGFRVVVVVMGHYGKAHTIAMEEVVKQVEQELDGKLVIVAEPDYTWTRPQYKGDHAAANETSYMELFEPQTVDVSRLPTTAEAESIYNLGVQGPDPRTEASAERGRKQLDLLLSRAVPQIQAALEKADKIAATRPAATMPSTTSPAATRPAAPGD